MKVMKDFHRNKFNFLLRNIEARFQRSKFNFLLRNIEVRPIREVGKYDVASPPANLAKIFPTQRGSRSSSGTWLGGSVDAGRAYGHSRSSFLLGNA